MNYLSRLLLRTLFLWATYILLQCRPEACAQETSIQHLRSKRNDTASIMGQLRAGASVLRKNADSALPLLRRSLEQSIAQHYRDGIGMALFDLALAYSEKTRNDTALYLYNTSLGFLKLSRSYSHMVPAAYTNIAYIYYFKAEYPTAIRYLDSAVHLLEDATSPQAQKYLAITLNTMSAVYMRMGRLELSLDYLKRVEEISRKNDFMQEIAISLSNQGDLLTQMDRYEEANKKYREAQHMFQNNRSIEARSLHATMKSGYARLKLKQGKPSEAIAILKGLEDLNAGYRTENTMVVPNYTMGKAFLQLGEYHKAERYLIKALKKAGELGINDNLLNVHKALSEVYESIGRPDSALRHFKLYKQLQDSLLNNDRIRAISDIEARYRTAEQGREMAAKELQLSRQKEKLNRQELEILGISVAALLLIGFFWSRSLLSRQKQDVQAKQIRLLRQEKEIDEQRQQIVQLNAVMKAEERERMRISRELHDGVVSQLTGIKLHFKAALHKAESHIGNYAEFNKILEYLEDTADELRKTAHSFIPETVLKGGLAHAVSSYCEMMMKASGISVYFQYFGANIPQNADMEVPVYRIVQELVQNAIKHADCSRIIVELLVDGETMQLEVEDDGKGMPAETGKGIGLQNVHTRVYALGGKVHIESQAMSGTSINIYFPLKA